VIIGGTFNPVHMGHLFLAEEIRITEHYDRILLIPSSAPAHKEVKGNVTTAQRLEMLQLAVENLPGLELDPCEISRGGISYSIDTVRAVRASMDLSEKPTLVIGDDLFESFHTWKDADELVRLCDLLVAHRKYAERLDSPYPHRYLENKIIPLSSSELRQRISQGLAYRHLVPEAVFRYIEEHKLYRSAE